MARAKILAVVGTALFVGVLLMSGPSLSAQTGSTRIVRLAGLEIDPAQLDSYKAALRLEISTSIRVEPGVLTLYAVAVRDHPGQIRLFEIYANAAAYETHLQSAHFKQYKSSTAGMVKSLKLLETDPILLGTKRAREPAFVGPHKTWRLESRALPPDWSPRRLPAPASRYLLGSTG
jgi:quinol monooxygenase YgiN